MSKKKKSNKEVWDEHFKYEPILTPTIIMESLPPLPEDNIKIDVDEGEKETRIKIDLFPEDDLVHLGAYMLMREELFDALKHKTKIPHELIENVRSQKFQYADELALLLRFHLKLVRQTENTGKGPNVTKILTRSEISYFADDMLSGVIPQLNTRIEYPHHLFELIRSLLGVDNTIAEYDKKGDMEHFKRIAFELKVEDPNITNKEIAKIFGVHPSTITRWFNADDAQELEKKTKYSSSRIYKHWAKNPNLSNDQLAHLVGVEPALIKELHESKYHKVRLKLGSIGVDAKDLRKRRYYKE